MYSTPLQPSNSALDVTDMNAGSGTINPAALNTGLPQPSIEPSPRGTKRSRSPDQYGQYLQGADDDEDSKRRKRGRPSRTPRGSADFTGATDSLPAPSSHASPSHVQTPQLKSQPLPQNTATTPVQASPPPRATPKQNVKALPSVRDHTSDQLTPEEDEYIPREHDEEGEKKVDALGHLIGDENNKREYRCRTFVVPGRGEKLFMLATECARVLAYRDSYLLFNKNRSLYKIIATQKEKEDLIAKDILPFSYRSRQIAIVTARSMFRQFGSRVIEHGRRVRDDYWEAKARKQGFTEADAAGEKRPGATKAREVAQAESHVATRRVFATGDIVYSNGPGYEGIQPPPLPPGIASIMPPPATTMSHDLRYSDIVRPRQEISGPPYIDNTRPSTEAEIMGQAAHAADYSKALNQQRGFRKSLVEGFWNKPHEPPVSTPQSQAAEPATATVSQAYTSPRFSAVNDPSGSQSALPSYQQQSSNQPMNPPSYPHQQNPLQSPLRQSSIQGGLPAQYAALGQPQMGRSSNLSMSQTSAHGQGNPYAPFSPHANPQHPQQQSMWGAPPPQPQQTPALHRMPTPQYSPSLGHGQIPSPIPQQYPGQHHSPSPHPPQQQAMQPPNMLHHQSSGGSLSSSQQQQMFNAANLPGMQGQQAFPSGYPGMGQRNLYAGMNPQGSPGAAPQQQQYGMPQSSQPGMQGWPGGIAQSGASGGAGAWFGNQ